jgi:two-component system KDP operon response regulator KdpE
MNGHVLVVDDEPQICRALGALLKAHGFTVEAVGTGSAALTAAATFEPELVVLDLKLPDMEGREVCLRLRRWSAVPVIVLSVYDDERTKIAALDSGADDYLVKPFSAGELLARIRALRRRVHEATPRPSCASVSSPSTWPGASSPSAAFPATSRRRSTSSSPTWRRTPGRSSPTG